ncbi:hypothetical protein C8Q73DRAFT_665149 [Cubamyces lactineus]|nr:hypothetical protein C8Q73DRAFT_665149 [Cubamyces lactineus]
MKSVLRRLPTHASRCRPSLSALKTTLQIVNSAGTSVPGLQAAVGTVLQIVEYAEAVKQNRKDAEELATSAAQIVQALLQSTEDLKTEEIDDAFRKDVVDFHRELQDGLRSLYTLKVAEQVAPPPPGLPAAENPSFWPTFYRTTALDHVHIAIDFLAPTSTIRCLSTLMYIHLAIDNSVFDSTVPSDI